MLAGTGGMPWTRRLAFGAMTRPDGAAAAASATARDPGIGIDAQPPSSNAASAASVASVAAEQREPRVIIVSCALGRRQCSA